MDTYLESLIVHMFTTCVFSLPLLFSLTFSLSSPHPNKEQGPALKQPRQNDQIQDHLTWIGCSQLVHSSDSVFAGCPSNALCSSSPSIPDLIQAHLLHLALVPLVSFKLDQFLSFSLSLMTLTFLECAGQCFLAMQVRDYAAKILSDDSSRNITLVGPWCWFAPLLVMATLITWFR